MSDPAWFAGRLRELRAKAGLTQRELADKAGMKEAGVRNLEQGRTGPAWESVLALANALGVSCQAFAEAPADVPTPTRGRPRKASAIAEAQQEDKEEGNKADGASNKDKADTEEKKRGKRKGKAE